MLDGARFQSWSGRGCRASKASSGLCIGLSFLLGGVVLSLGWAVAGAGVSSGGVEESSG